MRSWMTFTGSRYTSISEACTSEDCLIRTPWEYGPVFELGDRNFPAERGADERRGSARGARQAVSKADEVNYQSPRNTFIPLVLAFL